MKTTEVIREKDELEYERPARSVLLLRCCLRRLLLSQHVSSKRLRLTLQGLLLHILYSRVLLLLLRRLLLILLLRCALLILLACLTLLWP